MNHEQQECIDAIWTAANNIHAAYACTAQQALHVEKIRQAVRKLELSLQEVQS